MGWKSVGRMAISRALSDMMNFRSVPTVGSFGSEVAEEIPSRSSRSSSPCAAICYRLLPIQSLPALSPAVHPPADLET